MDVPQEPMVLWGVWAPTQNIIRDIGEVKFNDNATYHAEEVVCLPHHQPRSSERLLNKSAAARRRGDADGGRIRREEEGDGRSRDRSLRFRVDSFNL